MNTSGALGVNTGVGTVGFGTSGQVLTSAGTSASPTWSTPAGGTGFRTHRLASGTTYTPNAQVKSFYVFVYGSTGGQSTATNKGGVGGSGYSESYFSSPSGSYSYAIGAGGTTSGTQGGSTTFGGVITVTGSGGVTTTAGSAGGVGSGGNFNATGGSGGTAVAGFSGGGGGAATRAGNGGNGGNATGGTVGGGGGGTGGNNASANTGGAAATTVSGSALNLSTTLGTILQSWVGGASISGGTRPGGRGAAPDQIQDIIFLWQDSGNQGAAGGIETSTAVAGNNGGIVIIEILGV